MTIFSVHSLRVRLGVAAEIDLVVPVVRANRARVHLPEFGPHAPRHRAVALTSLPEGKPREPGERPVSGGVDERLRRLLAHPAVRNERHGNDPVAIPLYRKRHRLVGADEPASFGLALERQHRLHRRSLPEADAAARVLPAHRVRPLHAERPQPHPRGGERGCRAGRAQADDDHVPVHASPSSNALKKSGKPVSRLSAPASATRSNPG